MRTPLDRMIVSLREALSQMLETLNRLLVAVYATEPAYRPKAVAQSLREIDRHMAAMESLIIELLATQQPVLATDLSVVKGLLLTSRRLGYIAHEQRDLAHLMEVFGITDAHLPPEVKAVLPELLQALTEAGAAFLDDDWIGAELTFERIHQLEGVLHAVPTPAHPPTLVPVSHLHLLALQHVLEACSEIAHSAPLYRYLGIPD